MGYRTNETVTCGSLSTLSGYRRGSFGSITSEGYANGITVYRVQYNTSGSTFWFGLDMTSSFAGIDGKWGILDVGGTLFYREQAVVVTVNGNEMIWKFSTGTNPVPNGTVKTVRIGYVSGSIPGAVSASVANNLTNNSGYPLIAHDATSASITVTTTQANSGYGYGLYKDLNDDNNEWADQSPQRTPFQTNFAASSNRVFNLSGSDLPAASTSTSNFHIYYSYYARRGFDGGALGSTNEGNAGWLRGASTEAKAVRIYRARTPDLAITLLTSNTITLPENDTNDVVVQIANGTNQMRYRLMRTDNNTQIDLVTFPTWQLYASYLGGELPPPGETWNYVIEGRFTKNSGGDAVWRVCPGTEITITREAPLSGPDPFSFTDVTNAVPSTVYKQSLNITGLTGPVTATASGDLTISLTENGTYGTTISNFSGGTIWGKITSDSANNSGRNGTLDINSVTDNWSVTTGGASGGGSGLPGVPSQDWGLKILSPSGSYLLLSPDYRYNNLVSSGTAELLNGQSTGNITCPGAEDANKVAIMISSAGSGITVMSVTRSLNAFSITNGSGETRTITWAAVRYG